MLKIKFYGVIKQKTKKEKETNKERKKERNKEIRNKE